MLADVLLKVAGMTADDPHDYYPRPSIAGPNRCIRQMVMWGLGLERNRSTPDRMIMVFDDGKWHEELTNDWIRKTAFKLHSEQMELDCAPPMKTGHIDGLLTDMEGMDTLLEEKSMNHFSFQRWWDGKEYPEDYFTQVAIYAESIQRTLNPELKKALLLIKNKNTSQYMEYLCDYDEPNDVLLVINRTNSNGITEQMNKSYPDIVSNAIIKFNQVENYIKKKKLPERQYYKDDWHCDYCSWCDTCWQGYEEEQSEKLVKLPNEFAEKVKARIDWKIKAKIGEKAEKEIKNYMRIKKLTVAQIGNTLIERTVTEKGDRFRFKEIKK